ncbi:MAG: metallophosphoesterase [Candidatus Omnitrophota bacterium]
MRRTIIFGDIHGCWKEWKALIKKLRVTSRDRLYCVGDLTCKGPSTRKTLDMAMAMRNFRTVRGNHDQALIEIYRNPRHTAPKKTYHKTALRELGKRREKYIRFMESWPLYIKTRGFILVHGGLRPRIPIRKQAFWDLLTLRTIAPGNRPWYEFYKGRKLIVHGHWARQELVVRKNVIGLDTGCVYGGSLVALILPERRIVSVPARKVYVKPRRK